MSFRWLLYAFAKFGWCSSSSCSLQPCHHHLPVPKQLSTCQRSPPCPKMSYHSSLPLPWDINNHLFLHLWQTLYFLSSTYPSVHISIVLYPCAWLSFPLWALLYTCAILPVQSLSDGLCDREGLSDSAKSYPHRFVFVCTPRQIHVQHLCIVHTHQHQGLSHLAIREMWQLD